MRKRIGVIVDNLYVYQWNILEGIFSCAEKYNTDIFCFVGKTLNSPFGYEKYANKLYYIISKEDINGVIIFSSALSSNTSQEEILNFCKHFSNQIPTVSIGLPIDGIPSLIVDNVKGFKDMLLHLIEDHGYRKFAFVTGPLDNIEAEIRYNTFLEIMSKYRIKITEKEIFYGDFLHESGKNAIRTFLDERKIKPEVIVFSNDDMALSAIEELKERGFILPDDIKITGFDDVEEASFITPPLTTIRQPLFEMGCKALETVLNIIQNKNVPNIINLPTKLIIRDSCGCRYESIERAKIEDKKTNIPFPFERLETLKEEFLSYSKNTINNVDPEILVELYSTFLQSLKEKEQSYFLNSLERLLKIKEKTLPLLGGFQDYISVLRRFIVYYLEKNEDIFFLENLLHQARVIISDYAERSQGYKKAKLEEEFNLLSYTGIDVISSFNKENIITQLKNNLPNLGIKSFYIVEYEDKEEKPKLIVGYNENQELRDIYISKNKILPQKILPKRRVTYIVLPLHYQDKFLGYSLFELGSLKGILYEILKTQISAGLQGANLFEEKEKYEEELKENIRELSILNEIGSAITSSIELELIQDLILKEISKAFRFSSFYLILYKENSDKNIDIKIKKLNDPKDKLTSKDKNIISRAIKEQKTISTKSNKNYILCVSLTTARGLKGTIVLKNKEEPYSERTIKLLNAISTYISIALENAYLFEETKKLATTDPLTGILNRRALEEEFKKESSRAQRYNRPLSVMIIDVDDFKLFNDTYGHDFGDKVLKEIAKFLKTSCRKVDIIGRYGGDEFCILLPETNLEGAIKVAERLFKKLKEIYLTTPTNNKIPIRLSIGIASYPQDTNDPEKLLTLADTAMYKAKTFGGNQYTTLSSPQKEKLSKVPNFDIFLGLVNAIDNKDNYTYTHCQDVAQYAVKLGEKLGISKEDLEILKLAGKLHDIGKIGIPSEILKKPGPLTDEEWEIIKEHPRLGYLILNQLPKMEKLLQAILYHHERYDGKGYPQSLQGKDIPLLARILSIADAYSAMRSDRPYRKALTKKEIIEEIKRNAGRQFDPEIAQKFIELLEKSEIE